LNAHLLLDAFGLKVTQAGLLGDGVGHVLAAHQQNADEPGHAVGVHHDVRHPGADVDEGLGRDVDICCGGQGPQHREAGQIDRLRHQTCGLHGTDVGHHGLAGCGDEQPTRVRGAVDGNGFDRVEVEYCLVDRHRQVVLHLEGQGLLQVGRGHLRQFDLAHDDPLVGDSQDHLLVAEPGRRPQVPNRLGDGSGVDDLTVTDSALGKRNLTELLKSDTLTSERQLGCSYPGCPDVKADRRTSSHVTSPSSSSP
jgi:hypothetical protein